MEDMIEKVDVVTPYEVAQVLHMNAENIRAGLRAGIFPFGFAIPPKKEGGKWVYKIIKSKFINWLKDKNEEVITNEL